MIRVKDKDDYQIEVVRADASGSDLPPILVTVPAIGGGWAKEYIAKQMRPGRADGSCTRRCRTGRVKCLVSLHLEKLATP